MIRSHRPALEIIAGSFHAALIRKRDIGTSAHTDRRRDIFYCSACSIGIEMKDISLDMDVVSVCVFVFTL